MKIALSDYLNLTLDENFKKSGCFGTICNPMEGGGNDKLSNVECKRIV